MEEHGLVFGRGFVDAAVAALLLGCICDRRLRWADEEEPDLARTSKALKARHDGQEGDATDSAHPGNTCHVKASAELRDKPLRTCHKAMIRLRIESWKHGNPSKFCQIYLKHIEIWKTRRARAPALEVALGPSPRLNRGTRVSL